MGGSRSIGVYALVCILVASCSTERGLDGAPSNGGAASTASSAASTASSTTSTAPEWVRPDISTPGEEAAGVSPGESIQAAVDAAAEGDTIVIEPGMHRLQTVEPKAGQTIAGAPGALMSGAMLLSEFSEVDGLWARDGITAEGEIRGLCVDEQTACDLPEDLYIDGERIRRQRTLEAVDAESWYLDYETDTLYLGRNPGESVVELSVTPYAFGGGAENVTIQGLVIETYASPAQRGAINAGRGWTILGNEIRFNHGAGLFPGSDSLVTDNYFHHNGQMAIDGGGEHSVYESNEIAFNHLGDFSFEWGAGGVKFVHTTGLVLRDNFVHHNHGPGLWIDGYNVDTLFEGNRVIENFDAGIKIEISGSATVRDNLVVGNGFGNEFPPRGAGIMIRESGPVEVVGNELRANQEALVLHHDNDRENDTGNTLHGVLVHDNEIALDGGVVGYFGDIPFDAFETADLTFEENTYVGSDDEALFLDHGTQVRFDEWVESGRDAGSTLSATASSG
jgi:parallel beta-helix repeat protein